MGITSQKSKRLSSKERKKSIVLSCLPLFAKQGFQTTTKELAKAANVSEALLYKHFSSKEDLYEEMHLFCCEETEEVKEILINERPSIEGLIKGIFFLICAIAKGPPVVDVFEHEQTSRLMTYSFLSDGKFARLYLNKKLNTWRPFLLESMKVAISEKALIPLPYCSIQDSAWLAHHLAVGLKIVNMPKKAVVDYDCHSMDELIRSSVWFVLRGLGLKDIYIKNFFHKNEDWEALTCH